MPMEKKKSFLILTLLGPILMAAMIVIPVLVAENTGRDAKVLVVDDNDYFINRFTDNEKLHFSYQSGDIDQLKMKCVNGEFDAVLHILEGSQFNKMKKWEKDLIYRSKLLPLSHKTNKKTKK